MRAPMQRAESLWATNIRRARHMANPTHGGPHGLLKIALSRCRLKKEREKRVHAILIKDNVHELTVTVRYRLRPCPNQDVHAPSDCRGSPGLTQDVHAPSDC